MSEQAGNATRPSLAVLTNQKQSIPLTTYHQKPIVTHQDTRYIVALWRVALGDHHRDT